MTEILISSISEFEAYSHSEDHECSGLVTIHAVPNEEYQEARAPVNIVAVFDKSGSMGGEKIRLARETLKFIIDELTETDKLAIVTFDSYVSCDYQLTKMSAENKERAKSIVRAIAEGSATDLYSGLCKGIHIASECVSEAVTMILLMTDGEPCGAAVFRSDDIIHGMKRTIEAKHFMGSISTLGFGQGHNSALLERIAHESKGTYHQISDTAQNILCNYTAEWFGGAVSTVTVDTKILLEVQHPYLIKHVRTTWPVTWRNPQESCEVLVGDLQSEEQRDIIIVLACPVIDCQVPSHLALSSTVLCNAVNTSGLHPYSTEPRRLKLERTYKPPGRPNKKVDTQKNRILTYEALEEAREYADKGNQEMAKKCLKKAANAIKSSESKDDKFSRKLVENLSAANKMLETDGPLTKDTLHFMAAMKHSHATQRSNLVDETSPYRTPSQKRFVDKAIERTAEWRTSSFKDYQLFVHERKPNGNIKAILHICHGTYEHMGRYRALAEYLSDNNIFVRSFDLVGHGRSKGDHTEITSVTPYSTDIINHIKESKRDYPQVPVFLMGHSDGGVVALEVSLTIQNELKGLILSAPAMSLLPLTERLVDYLRGDSQTAMKMEPQQISSVQKEVDEYVDDHLVHKDFNPNWIIALKQIVEKHQPKLSDIKIPVLSIHGTNDKFVPLEGSISVVNDVSDPDTTLEMFIGSRHEVLHDKDEERALKLVSDWMLTRAK